MKNIQLLKDTMEWIKAHPEQHNQGVWGYTAKEACSTFMCFAGHAAVLAGGTFDRKIFLEEDEWHVDAETGKHVPTEYVDIVDEYGDPWDDELKEGIIHVAEFAAEKLGLDEDEKSYLFAGHRSRAELEEFVEKADQGYKLVWRKQESGYYDYNFVKEEN